MRNRLPPARRLLRAAAVFDSPNPPSRRPFSAQSRAVRTLLPGTSCSCLFSPPPPFLFSITRRCRCPDDLKFVIRLFSDLVLLSCLIQQYKGSPGALHGLKWALAGRGVLVKERLFHNLEPFELLQKGATRVEGSSGFPVYSRGNALGGTSEISNAQFSKLLKQVTTHISSVSTVFVQDGAVGSSPKFDAKVRIISDSASAVLSLSNIFWETPSRSISHDSCPLTVYVATSVSPSMGNIIGLKPHVSDGLVAADIERSSLILCGKAFVDVNSAKVALSALAAPIITARGGLPLSARILNSGESVILLFASEATVQKCSNLHNNLVSMDAGVVLSSHGVAPFFHAGEVPAKPSLLGPPASMVITSADSSGVLPSLSKLSLGQTAYHFLAGYQDGKFIPTYCEGPSPIPPLELAKALLSHLKKNNMPSFLINVSDGGKKLLMFVESPITTSILESSFGSLSDPKVGNLRRKYKSFLSGKFQDLPEEFSF